MTTRERVNAILHYEPCDRLPLVHFGYWRDTLEKWAAEGHISEEQARGQADGNEYDREIEALLGFDCNWQTKIKPNSGPAPAFTREVVAEFPDGSTHVRNVDGVVILQRPGAGSIPAEIEHTLTDRDSFEAHYRHRYEWSASRVDTSILDEIPLDRERQFGLHCGSLYGHARDVIGIVGISYLAVDDEELYREIIDIIADVCYRNTKFALEYVERTKPGFRFDFAHFWEDICFKTGPLVNPTVFRELCGPHYKRITDLCAGHGIDIVSLDCDGKIDELIPIWLDNGVNTMFPVEVGTWNASIAPWRERYGRELRGVGGMDKRVFAFDRAAVDAEVERLRPLVELGGYIPCPDHRIAPDAKWDLVKYYCERMRETFG
jgi:hypothetical protein